MAKKSATEETLTPTAYKVKLAGGYFVKVVPAKEVPEESIKDNEIPFKYGDLDAYVVEAIYEDTPSETFNFEAICPADACYIQVIDDPTFNVPVGKETLGEKLYEQLIKDPTATFELEYGGTLATWKVVATRLGK
jgi:hypothetical protein